MENKPKDVKLPKCYDGCGTDKPMKFAPGWPAFGGRSGEENRYGSKPIRGTGRQRQAKTFGKNG